MRKRHDPLAAAHEANRDLRNQLQQVEQPLRLRIRELEAEIDRRSNQIKEDGVRLHELERGMEAALGLVRWLISSGKSR